MCQLRAQIRDCRPTGIRQNVWWRLRGRPLRNEAAKKFAELEQSRREPPLRLLLLDDLVDDDPPDHHAPDFTVFLNRVLGNRLLSALLTTGRFTLPAAVRDGAFGPIP